MSLRPHSLNSFDSTQQAFPLSSFQRSAESRFTSIRLLSLAISSTASPTRHAASATLAWAACTSTRASSGNRLVLRLVELCVGVRRCLGDHQSPLNQLAGPRGLALVVDDGSTQVARGSISRASGPGLDDIRRNPVVDGLGLLFQLQYLEVLWHKRSRGGGCCTRGKIGATPKPRVSLFPWHPRHGTQRTKRNLVAHVQSVQQCSQMEDAVRLQLYSNACGRAVLSRCDVSWVESPTNQTVIAKRTMEWQ